MILGKDDPTRMKGISCTFKLNYFHTSRPFYVDCIAVIRNKNGEKSEGERLAAFDELEMIVEGIDNASNMDKMNLWPEIFSCISSNESIEVVKFALWIIGTCAQNNPETQVALLQKHDIFSRLLAVWNTFPEARAKVMYCLSALLSNNPNGLEDFAARSGFAVIENFDESESGQVIAKKLKFLLCTVLGLDAVGCLIKDCPKLMTIMESLESSDEE